ncbi:hypothetical protein WP50_36010 [Lactiplantibacillus plantarum]|nr:hypothetical protein WP50_36010 [Lactiplantibacillus plantarum]
MPIYNFSAGPAVLPQPVITQIQAELPSFRDSGMSILEISHRSDLFAQVLQDAEQDLVELLNLVIIRPGSRNRLRGLFYYLD